MSAKKLIFYLTIALVLYKAMFLKKKYSHEVELEVKNLEPRQTWALFTDFSQLKLINPTIISFSIQQELKQTRTDDNGSPSREFTVIYTEHLVYLPFVTHEAEATFEIYEEDSLSQHPFRISSRHRTYVMGVSLDTTETTVFLPLTNTYGKISTRLISNVEFECQIILAYYCEMEFLGQRSLIHKNLLALTSIPT